MSDLENQLGMRAQQIFFGYENPRRTGIQIPEYNIDRIENISQKILKNSRDCQSFGWIRGPTSLKT